MPDERPDDPASGDAPSGDDFRLAWGEEDDRWSKAATGNDRDERSRASDHDRDLDVNDVPWDELADDEPFESTETKLVADDEDDDHRANVDDEAPPQGDPLERDVEGEVYERPRAGDRMDSLQDALASIRQRVQSLSDTVQAPGRPQAGSSQLALYRAATEDRAYAELRRHGRDTEDMLRRLSTLMQDLSLDLRGIVDAARRAIDQTSEQAESSIEMGRLLGERIEQLDARISARVEALGKGSRGTDAVAGRIEQIVKALDKLHRHLDTRLTKLEQRAGVGVLREEVGEVRAELGDVRGDVGDLRAEVGNLRADIATSGADSTATALHDRMEVVSGQLDNTLAMLRDIVEGTPDQEGDVADAMAAVIRAETEAAVEPLRQEMAQLNAAVEGVSDDVERVRKRIARGNAPVRASSTTAKKTTARRTAKRAVEPDDELEVDEETPAERPARAAGTTKKKATPRRPVDINEPFAPGELSLSRDVEPDEEPIRRARGESTKKAARPLTKSRRARTTRK